jgi:predicted permease
VVGLALALWGGGLLRAVLLPDVDWSSGTVDVRLLAATAAAAVVAGVLGGLTPALQAGRVDGSGARKAGGREGSVHRSRTRDALLVLQVALSLVLLIGAGVFARSLHNVRSLDLGFDPERVLYVSAELGPGRQPEAARKQFVDRLIARARELPQVERASRTATVPYYMSWADDLHVPGVDSVERLGEFLTNAVSPDYFATMGTRIVRGRGFTDADRKGAGLVAVVDETMARTLWHGADPIGRCIRVGSDSVPCTTVVGVAQAIRSGSLGEPTMIYYLPEAQRYGPGTGLFIRTRGPARESSEAVRRELQRLASGDVYVEARALQDLVDPEVRPWQLGATMFSAFGAVALLLAAVGLYGVIAFNVAQRSHEVGVRIALGAGTRDILRLIVGDGVRVAVVGIALGGVVALAAGRFVAPLLFEVSPRDPLTLGVVVATLLAIAVAASWIPGWRATRVDPSEALRAD